MTVSSTTRQAGPYHGNDIVAAFPFAFRVFSAGDVQVVQTDPDGVETTLTLTTHYTVSLNANQNSNPGGTVTAVSAPATGYKWTLTSDIDPLQAIDLTNLGGFYPAVINTGFDKLTILVQQVLNKVARSIKIPISDNSGEITIPTAAGRANRFLAFDGDGNPIAATGLASSPVSAFMAPVVAAATAPAARALLGFDSSSGGDFLVFQNTAAAAEAAVRIDVTQTTSGASLKMSNSGLNTQATLRARADGGVTVYVGQTAGAGSTSGVQAVDVDAVGNVQVGIAGIAGGRTVQIVNTDTGAGSFAQTFLQSNAGAINLQVNSTAGGGTASILSSATGAMSIGSTIAAALNFVTNNIARLTITSAGAVNATVSLSDNNCRVFSRATGSMYESAETTITNSSWHVWSHGLAGVPVSYKIIARCKTAEQGYAVGDEIDVTCGGSGTDYYFTQVNATQIAWALPRFLLTANRTTASSVVNLTAGNWRVIARAHY